MLPRNFGYIRRGYSKEDWIGKNVYGAITITDIPDEKNIIDLSKLIIHNQENIPACTGCSGAKAQEINQYKETGKMEALSWLDLYKLNKSNDGIPGQEGSTMQATVDNLRFYGVTLEVILRSTWANYIDKYLVRSKEAIEVGKFNRIASYVTTPTIEEILVMLAKGNPVVFGMLLTSNFFDTKNGFVPDEPHGFILGGHAMTAVGYNITQRFPYLDGYIIIPQSWGMADFTDNGFMYIPFKWFRAVLELTVDIKIPHLDDAYACLDFIPPKEIVMPEIITVKPDNIIIRVDGKPVDLPPEMVKPFIAEELGATLVHVRNIKPIIEALIGEEVYIEWNERDKAVDIVLA